MTTKSKFPQPPPHKTVEEYVEAMQKNVTFIPYTPQRFIDRKAREYEWHHGGMVTTWNSIVINDDDNDKKCLYHMALVRGDGKILSSIDTKTRSCDTCTNYFATVVEGHLKGIEASGMYIYK